MKKISSAIFLVAFFAFINCKSNVGEASKEEDPTSAFYQSVIKLGNGFLDVFTSFGGLVADAFGLKADPKKSEIKDFFTSIATKLEGTIDKLSKLPKENGNSENKSGKEGDLDNTNNDIAKAINGTIETLKKMIGAAKKIAGATDGEVKIGEVGTADNQGAAADQASVNGIADGMKEIVDAGGKDALKAAGAAAAGGNNKEAGKLFGGTNGNADGAGDNDIGKAAAAVNAVSGEQILKAIVDAAGGDNKDGAAAGAANNPIAAAIGTDAQGGDFGAGMNNSSDKIAAAIVLRGMAKNGKFSLADHNDAQKAKVKSVVHQGTSKTILALTNLIQKVAEEGLTTVAKAVKAVSTNGGPTPKKSN